MIRKKKHHDHTHESHELFWLFKLVESNHKELLNKIRNINIKIMATQKEIVEQLEAKADAIQASLDDKQSKIDSAFTALKTQVAELQAQIAAGGTIDLGPLSAKLDALAVDLASTPEG